MARIHAAREKARLFRGWSRICLHAASLSGTEGTCTAPTAAARAARAEGIGKELRDATLMAQARREETATTTDVTAAKGEETREVGGTPRVVAGIERWERDQRRVKMLVRN